MSGLQTSPGIQGQLPCRLPQSSQQPLGAGSEEPQTAVWPCLCVVWPSQEGSPLSAVQGMRGQRPWPSCRRPPWTAARTDAPSTTSMARPPLTSASAPKVRVPPAVPRLAPGRAAAICAEMVLSGQSSLRAAALSPFSPHSAVRIHLQRRRGRYGAPGGGVGAFIPVLPSAGDLLQGLGIRSKCVFTSADSFPWPPCSGVAWGGGWRRAVSDDGGKRSS